MYCKGFCGAALRDRQADLQAKATGYAPGHMAPQADPRDRQAGQQKTPPGKACASLQWANELTGTGMWGSATLHSFTLPPPSPFPKRPSTTPLRSHRTPQPAALRPPEPQDHGCSSTSFSLFFTDASAFHIVTGHGPEADNKRGMPCPSAHQNTLRGMCRGRGGNGDTTSAGANPILLRCLP